MGDDGAWCSGRRSVLGRMQVRQHRQARSHHPGTGGTAKPTSSVLVQPAGHATEVVW